MEQNEFWKPKPREPSRDWRTWSLLIPGIASAIGFFCFAILTYSFAEIEALPATFRSTLVIFGAICVAAGAEIGTPFTVIEIYRKWLRNETNNWDWWALAFSLCATLAEVLIGFAYLLGITARWSAAFLEWGPIVVGLLVALDAYGSLIELGFLFADYENRMAIWLEEKAEAVGKMGQEADPLAARLGTLEKQIAQLSWPIAKKADWYRIVAGLDGKRASLDFEMVTDLLIESKLRMPSDQTVRRWIAEARE